jgi:predicted kinase
LLTHGVSGSGKTYGTQGLVETFGAIRLRADVERKRLFGLPAQARPTIEQARQLYADSATERTYARLAELSALLLQAGWPVIIDATFLAAAQRRRFIELFRQMQVPWAMLDFQAPAEVLRARVVARRQRADDASDADLAVLAQQLERAEVLQPDELAQTVSIDTTQADYPADLPARVRQRLDLD